MDRRFWEKVAIGDGCWEWTGAKTYGYGYYRLSGPDRKIERAHRYAAGAMLGDGVVWRHQCDNAGCVRRSHLEPGTHADNVADKVSKGRQRAKLTPATVLEILASNANNAELAAKYSVDRRTVRDIRSRRYWRHVQLEGK